MLTFGGAVLREGENTVDTPILCPAFLNLMTLSKWMVFFFAMKK